MTLATPSVDPASEERPIRFSVPVARLAVALIALGLIAAGLVQLARTTNGLRITRMQVGTIPVTVFEQPTHALAPLVVIAHGFAGSQQLMQPFAVTLARNGYVAVTFDFQGHGRNSAPLGGSLTEQETFSRGLVDTLGQVVTAACALPGQDGRVALLGHSMASDVVVRYAQAHPAIEATVAVSLFFPGATATSPRNLLILDGALEASMLHDEGLRIVNLTAGGSAQPGTTYGRFDEGTARRLALAGGVEHIGILYSGEGLRESLAWLDAAFGRPAHAAVVDRRGGALGLLYLGLLALAWPLSACLPRVSAQPQGAGLRWRQLWPIAVAPAMMTPLILWPLPTTFLPILLGDYLVLHFALYGALTWIGLRWLQTRADPFVHRPVDSLSPHGATPIRRQALVAALAAFAASAYGVFAIGLPIDRYVTSFLPGPWRVPLIAAMLAGTLPYFLADEWLTRGVTAPRGAYAATKLCFLLSLVIAVALNLEKLFFLIIIVPVILLFFGIYGLFSHWIGQRTNHPFVAGLANALVFAWFIAVTFPVVSR